MSLHAAQRIRMDILGALKSLEEERDAVVARMAMLQAPPYALDAESQEVREAKALAAVVEKRIEREIVHLKLLGAKDRRAAGLSLAASAKGLPKMDRFGMADPYFAVHRLTPEEDAAGDVGELVYRSEVKRNRLDVEWEPFVLPLVGWMDGHEDDLVRSASESTGEGADAGKTVLRFDVWDRDFGSPDDYIGSAPIALGELHGGSDFVLELAHLRKDLSPKTKATHLGSLHLVRKHDADAESGAGPRGSGIAGTEDAAKERGSVQAANREMATAFLRTIFTDPSVTRLNDEIRELEQRLFSLQENEAAAAAMQETAASQTAASRAAASKPASQPAAAPASPAADATDSRPMPWTPLASRDAGGKHGPIVSRLLELFSAPAGEKSVTERLLSEATIECRTVQAFVYRFFELQAQGDGVVTLNQVAEYEAKMRASHGDVLPAYTYTDPFDVRRFVDTLETYIMRKHDVKDKRSVHWAVSNAVFPQLYAQLLAQVGNGDEEAKYAKQCARFAALTQEQLGIDVDAWGSRELVPFAMAIARLKAQFYSQTPERKLIAIYAAARQVKRTVAAEHGGYQLTDGQFVLVWQYVVLKAAAAGLAAGLAFVREYGDRELLNSDAGYYFRLTEKVVDWIGELDDSQLQKTGTVADVAFLVAEKDRYRGWLSVAGGQHFQMDVEPRTVRGYKLVAVREWTWDPAYFYWCAAVHTGNEDDSVRVYRVSARETATQAQKRMMRGIFLEPSLAGMRAEQTPEGSLLVADLEALQAADPRMLTFVDVPDGAYDAFYPLMRAQLTLQLLGCADGACTISGTAVPEAWEANFRSTYRVRASKPLEASLASIVCELQVLLYLFDYMPLFSKCDGVFGRVTRESLKQYQYHFRTGRRLSFDMRSTSDDTELAAIRSLVNEGNTAPTSASLAAADGASGKDDSAGEPGVLNARILQALRHRLRHACSDLTRLGFQVLRDPRRHPDDFVRLVKFFQSSSGLIQDGRLGFKTIERIAEYMRMLTSVRLPSEDVGHALDPDAPEEHVRLNAVEISKRVPVVMDDARRAHFEREMPRVLRLQRWVRGREMRRRFRLVAKLYRSSPSTRKLRHRHLLYKELLDTEQSFVSNMDLVAEAYLHPMASGAMAKHVSADDVKVVFSNFEVIRAFNHQLLALLLARYAKWPSVQLIGDIFLRLADFFKLYTIFVNNYDACIQRIIRLRQSSKFDTFLATTAVRVGKDLMSLLIQPVQRLPRYLLLLGQLVKYTDPDHVDHGNLVQAETKLASICKHVNEKKREAESQMRLLALREKLRFESNDMRRVVETLITPGRNLVREGPALLVDPGTHVETGRMLVLLSDQILVCEEEKDTLVLEQCLNLDSTSLTREGLPDDVGEHAFRLNALPRPVLVHLPTAEEREVWLDALTVTIDEHHRKRTSFPRQTSETSLSVDEHVERKLDDVVTGLQTDFDRTVQYRDGEQQTISIMAGSVPELVGDEDDGGDADEDGAFVWSTEKRSDEH